MPEELFGYSPSMESQETEGVKRRVPLVAWLPVTIVVVLVVLLVIGVVVT